MNQDRILHLGVGNFQRAHQAVYTQAAGGWRIMGVSLKRDDTRQALEPQGFAYTLEVNGPKGAHYDKISVLEGILFAPAAPGKLSALIADAGTKMVSLTITEKGYLPAPGSAMEQLYEGLRLRSQGQAGGITLLSCDNLPSNGSVVKERLLEIDKARGGGLGAWLEENASFPSCMVDRIVPATTPALKARVKAATGFDDAWPVSTEEFSEWVIEDKFAAGRPSWEKTGVEFVQDVRPFELRKLRLLNGAHSTLAMLGLQKGLRYVHEAVADPELRQKTLEVMLESAQTLPEASKPGAEAYMQKLFERFSNSALNHELRQIATDSRQKLPIRIGAPLSERKKMGLASPALERTLAAWTALGEPN